MTVNIGFAYIGIMASASGTGSHIGSHPCVVVMGVTGSGKTTVGTLLSERMQVPFADADDFHPESNKKKMAAGIPLNDDDRAPWLAILARWLDEHPSGCVLACSALKRRYRDVLRRGGTDTCFLHLAGDPAVVTTRVANRKNHYMPVSLVQSQYDTLEPLEPDETGVVIDFDLPPDEIVERFLHEVL